MHKSLGSIATAFLILLVGCQTSENMADDDASAAASQQQNMYIGAPCESNDDCDTANCQYCDWPGECRDRCVAGLEQCVPSPGGYGICDNVTEPTCNWYWINWGGGPHWWWLCRN